MPEEQLRSIFELAKFGPTSANIDPLRILFVSLGKGRERLLPLLNEGNRAKTADAPVVAVLGDDHAFDERIPELPPSRPEMRESLAPTHPARKRGPLQRRASAAYFIIDVRAVGHA